MDNNKIASELVRLAKTISGYGLPKEVEDLHRLQRIFGDNVYSLRKNVNAQLDRMKLSDKHLLDIRKSINIFVDGISAVNSTIDNIIDESA